MGYVDLSAVTLWKILLLADVPASAFALAQLSLRLLLLLLHVLLLLLPLLLLLLLLHPLIQNRLAKGGG